VRPRSSTSTWPRGADISGDELPTEVKALRSFGLTASTPGEESGVHIRLVAG
jgi:hypothetical protein